MQSVKGQTYTSWEITADGTIAGARPAIVTVTSVLERQLTPGPGTLYAAFATAGTCDALRWDFVSTDSYDSRVGNDPAASRQENGGNVGTNGSLKATNSNTIIWGSLSTPNVGIGECSEATPFATTETGATLVREGIVAVSHPEVPAPPIPALPDDAPDVLVIDGFQPPLAPGNYETSR